MLLVLQLEDNLSQFDAISQVIELIEQEEQAELFVDSLGDDMIYILMCATNIDELTTLYKFPVEIGTLLKESKEKFVRTEMYSNNT